MDIDAEPQKGNPATNNKCSYKSNLTKIPLPHHQAYAWESEYKRGWELQEDEAGHLVLPRNKKKAKFQSSRRGQGGIKVHRGLIRNIVLVVDASRMMSG